MTNRYLGLLLAILLIAAAAAAFWYLRDEPAPATAPPPPPEPTDTASAPAPDPGPKFPIEPPTITRTQVPPLTPLPPLQESDAYFEIELVELFGSGIADILVDEALIEKVVATVDALPTTQVAEKVRPIGPLLGSFTVDGQDDSGVFTLNPASHERYDFLVNLMATADIEVVTQSYRRFYPLLQEAYVNLGYPNGHFNDRLVEVIDHLLATPDVDEPVQLVRPHVLYEFADPSLESLSGGQKILIRAGSDNGLRIKQFLEEFRDAITSGGTLR